MRLAVHIEKKLCDDGVKFEDDLTAAIKLLRRARNCEDTRYYREAVHSAIRRYFSHRARCMICRVTITPNEKKTRCENGQK